MPVLCLIAVAIRTRSSKLTLTGWPSCSSLSWGSKCAIFHHDRKELPTSKLTSCRRDSCAHFNSDGVNMRLTTKRDHKRNTVTVGKVELYRIYLLKSLQVTSQVKLKEERMQHQYKCNHEVTVHVSCRMWLSGVKLWKDLKVELSRTCLWCNLLLQQSRLLFLRQNSDQIGPLIPQDCHQHCNHSISIPGVHVHSHLLRWFKSFVPRNDESGPCTGLNSPRADSTRGLNARSRTLAHAVNVCVDA